MITFAHSKQIADSVANNVSDSLFLGGGLETDKQLLDPFVTGFALYKWIVFPKWVAENTQFTTVDNCTTYLEKTFREFSGISSFEISTGATQAGFTNREHMYITGSQLNQGFNMKFKEFSGSPTGQIFTTWATGIRDPRTGVATYPRLANVPYSAANHTGKLIYMVLKPSAGTATTIDPDMIEFATYITNIVPLKAPFDHFNYTAGSNDIPEIDMPFTGDFHYGADVIKAATAVYEAMKDRIVSSDQLTYDFSSNGSVSKA
jgi:hypothetical protein